MTSTSIVPTPFAYVESDLREGQTLTEWRREQYLARRTPRRRRLPRLRIGR